MGGWLRNGSAAVASTGRGGAARAQAELFQRQGAIVVAVQVAAQAGLDLRQASSRSRGLQLAGEVDGERARCGGERAEHLPRRRPPAVQGFERRSAVLEAVPPEDAAVAEQAERMLVLA